MDTDKLVKAIQIIVKEEIKVILPKLVKEGVKKEMAKLLKENKKLKEAVTPKQPTFMDEAVNEQPIQVNQTQRVLSKDPMLNKVLQQTQPLSISENTSKSVLDKQPPAYAGAPTEVSERTMQFDSNSTHTLGAQSIADKMGYGDMKPTGVKSGLGVSTGLAGLDRVLNRDNSQLIKAWDKSKGPWRPGM